MAVLGLAAIWAFVEPLRYWFLHPELSQMQLLIAKWPYYLGVIAWALCFFLVALQDES